MILTEKEAPQTDAVEKRTGHKFNGKLSKDPKKELGASAVLTVEKADKCPNVTARRGKLPRSSTEDLIIPLLA